VAVETIPVAMTMEKAAGGSVAAQRAILMRSPA
jgi:hypothetical protein